MNQGFKLKYNEMQENNPANNPDGAEQAPKADDYKYIAVGHVRNICFVWVDGKRVFLSYAYLISGEYNPEEAAIRLIFTTHSVLLKGNHLESLFYELMAQITRQIVCVDSRYDVLSEDKLPSVHQITLTETNA